MLKCCFGDPLGVDSTCSHPPLHALACGSQMLLLGKKSRPENCLHQGTRTPKSSQIFTWSTKLICTVQHTGFPHFLHVARISLAKKNSQAFCSMLHLEFFYCAWIWT